MQMNKIKLAYADLPHVSRLYLARQFFSAMYFSWPVWYGFASQRLSASQVGLYFSVLYATQLIAEIPTGAFADRFGRRKSALFGALLMPIMPLMLYFGHSFTAYLVAAFLYGISFAFVSGSLDALVYDDRKVSPAIFRKISIYEVTAFQSGLIISAALGGFLYTFNTALPFLFESLAAIASLLLIFLMKEEKIIQEKVVLQTNKYASYLKDGFRYLFATKELIFFVAAYLLYAVAITASIEFVNEAAMIQYGIAPEWRGLLISGTKVINLILLNMLIYKLVRGDKAKIVFFSLTTIVVFTLFSIPGLVVFLPAYIAFNWLSASRSAFFNPILHDRIPTSHRATTMSSLSALVGIGSLALYPVAGYLIEKNDNALAAYGMFLVMAIIAAALLLLSRIKQS
jgi:MFS family permease